LDAELAATWDVLKGYSGRDTDLGIARRFGGAAAAYSLRDVGAMNGRVVKARRDVDGQGSDPEEDFSANQVQNGSLEDWVNGKLESTPPADVATAEAAYSLRTVNTSYSGPVVKIRRSSDNTEQDFTAEELQDNTLTDFINGGESLLYGISGQSNAAGRAETSDAGTRFDALDALSNRVFMWDRVASAFVEFDFGVNQDKTGGNTSSQFGPESELLRLAAEANPNRKIYVVKYAIGGSSLFEDWSPGDTYYNTFKDDYLDAVAAIKASNENVIHKGVLFAQGERDAKGDLGGGTENYYESRQRDFIETLRTDLSLPNLPIALTLPSVRGSLGSTYYELPIINAAKSKLASIMNFVSTIDSSNFGMKSDDLHYNGSGQIEHGAEFFDRAVGTETSTGTGDGYLKTWYDQSGNSNHATQSSKTKQPKIVENAALLTDGIDFDGTDDELETGANITGSTINGFVVANLDGTDGKSLYSVGNTKPNVFFGNPSLVYAINGGTSLSGGTAPTLRDTLFTSLFISGGTSKGFINAVEIISGDAGSNSASSDRLTIGNLQSGDRFMNGSMKELILYTSDQSNNRFKIESNINNYYGLYNDENDLAGDFTSSGAESFTANGKDGFTLNNSKSTAFGGIELNQTLAAAEKIYVSFNLSIDAGANTSPNLNIREGSITGTAASTEGFFTPSEGFNSTVFTSDSGGDARYISFGENDADPSTYTISNFRVSRIERNGFVKTWYDQSGNSNDATQGSAGNQPAIVKNGGIIPEGIRFETDDELETGGNITTSTITGFVVANLKGTDAKTLYSLGSDSVSAPNVNFADPSLAYAMNGGVALSGGTAPTFSNTLFTQLFISGGTSKIFIDGSEIASGDAGSNTASSGKITIGNLASAAPNRYANIAMNELIVFTSDKSTDQDEIETDISRNYNITLS
jgi:hypothetical protein